MLNTIDELTSPQTATTALRLAAWFHDAVYIPGREDNEERSAFLAADVLEMIGAPPALAGEVSRLISLTNKHTPGADDQSGSILCDADLYILATPTHEYAQYAAGIREEFALVNDADFRVGRARVLRDFLQRPRIYSTPRAFDDWELRARRNIAEEVAQLEGSRE